MLRCRALRGKDGSLWLWRLLWWRGGEFWVGAGRCGASEGCGFGGWGSGFERAVDGGRGGEA